MGDAPFSNRHEKAAPASQPGHSCEEAKGEALVSLQTGIGPRSEACARCREALLMAGYLPAAPSSNLTVPKFTVPKFTGKREACWDRQFQAAEY